MHGSARKNKKSFHIFFCRPPVSVTFMKFINSLCAPPTNFSKKNLHWLWRNDRRQHSYPLLFVTVHTKHEEMWWHSHEKTCYASVFCSTCTIIRAVRSHFSFPFCVHKWNTKGAELYQQRKWGLFCLASHIFFVEVFTAHKNKILCAHCAYRIPFLWQKKLRNGRCRKKMWNKQNVLFEFPVWIYFCAVYFFIGMCDLAIKIYYFWMEARF